MRDGGRGRSELGRVTTKGKSFLIGMVTDRNSVGNFAAVDSRDEAVSNRTDRLVEVGLCGEDVDRSLR